MTDTTQQDQVPGAAAPDLAAAATGASGGCGCGGCGCGADAAQSGGARQDGLQISARPGESTTADAGPRAAVGVEPGDLDLRPLARDERHARVIAAVGGLLPGEGLVLANDNDPVGLRRQLAQEDLGHLGWQYLAEGPDVWRVLVSRDTCC
ncbi:MAG: DUF2249 domain-containing protein [Actinotalea sp.]|nr:DUF2249 domain-containing protein [Actinotalea sp.]